MNGHSPVAFMPSCLITFFMISSVDCVAGRPFLQVAGYHAVVAAAVVVDAPGLFVVVAVDAAVLFVDGVDAVFSFRLFPDCVS